MSESFTVPYRSLTPGGIARPYLVMRVTGINGQAEAVIGLIDSGADQTTLPFGYASLMGYTAGTLEQGLFNQVSGTGVSFNAKLPCRAHVPEIPNFEVELRPTFIQGAQVALWGRLDFMRKFDVMSGVPGSPLHHADLTKVYPGETTCPDGDGHGSPPATFPDVGALIGPR